MEKLARLGFGCALVVAQTLFTVDFISFLYEEMLKRTRCICCLTNMVCRFPLVFEHNTNIFPVLKILCLCFWQLTKASDRRKRTIWWKKRKRKSKKKRRTSLRKRWETLAPCYTVLGLKVLVLCFEHRKAWPHECVLLSRRRFNSNSKKYQDGVDPCYFEVVMHSKN